MNKFVLLSFDVEEFDMPLEYQVDIPVVQQMQIGKLGLDAIEPALSKINTTLFTTANFANQYPETIKTLANRHEIASHTFYHSKFEVVDLLSSRIRLQEISGQPITGLRMPRMRKVEMADVMAAGYQYDSSINPTYLPGRYNHFHLPRTVYTDKGMKRIPASVSPAIRIPLFWLSFKNMPYALFLALCKQTLAKDGYICLYFHPWEFTPIEEFGLPMFTRRWAGPTMVSRLLQLIKDLQKEGDFISINQLPNLR